MSLWYCSTMWHGDINSVSPKNVSWWLSPLRLGDLSIFSLSLRFCFSALSRSLVNRQCSECSLNVVRSCCYSPQSECLMLLLLCPPFLFVFYHLSFLCSKNVLFFHLSSQIDIPCIFLLSLLPPFVPFIVYALVFLCSFLAEKVSKRTTKEDERTNERRQSTMLKGMKWGQREEDIEHVEHIG